MSSIRPSIVFSLLASLTVAAEGGDKLRVYFGTYTRGGKSEGIYRAEFDTATGKLSDPLLAAKVQNPSFLTIAPSKKFIYAVGESGGPPAKKGEGPAPGKVFAFAVDPSTGDLKLLNEQSSGGAGPCHISIDATGRNVAVANYGGGSCGSLPIRDDGSLAPMSSFDQHVGTGGTPDKPSPPRGHSIFFDAANKFAVCADLGLDRLFVYRFDPAAGTLTPNDPPFTQLAAGNGPRHFAFHPSGRFAYVINERACTMTALIYDSTKGTLTEVQTISTLPPGETVQKGYSTAEVVCHPSGRFLYGSNRGQNSIVAYKIDENDGKLTLIGHQSDGVRVPRNFNVDPAGQYCLVANQDGDDVAVFKINPQTGALETKVGTVAIGSPVCIKFMPLE